MKRFFYYRQLAWNGNGDWIHLATKSPVRFGFWFSNNEELIDNIVYDYGCNFPDSNRIKDDLKICKDSVLRNGGCFGHIKNEEIKLFTTEELKRLFSLRPTKEENEMLPQDELSDFIKENYGKKS